MFLKVSRDRKRINVYLPTETETTALFSWKKLDYMMITRQGCTILQEECVEQKKLDRYFLLLRASTNI